MHEQHRDQARPNAVMISAKWPHLVMMLLAHAWQPTNHLPLHPFEMTEAVIGCTCLATIKEVVQAATHTVRQSDCSVKHWLVQSSLCVAPQAPQYSKGLSWEVRWLEGLGGGRCQSHTGAAR